MVFLPEIPKYGIHPNICKDNVLSKCHGVKRGNNNKWVGPTNIQK
jgi:hypothetical protein